MKLSLLYAYFGPNRRSNNTLVEAIFEYLPNEPDQVLALWPAAMEKLHQILQQLLPEAELPEMPSTSKDPDAMVRLAGLFGELGLIFQNSQGYSLAERGCLHRRHARRFFAWFAHDEASVGKLAAGLAASCLNDAFEGLQIEVPKKIPGGDPSELLPGFQELAQRMLQPVDCTAIIAAARRQGVPCIRLERDPYTPVQGDFRIRMNSMLMLGHSRHRQVIDGTFALEKSESAYRLLHDPQGALRRVAEWGFPVSGLTAEPANTRPWEILVAGQQLLAAFTDDTEPTLPGEHDEDIHPGIVRLCESIAGRLNVGMLQVSIDCADLSAPLKSGGAVITGLNLAPRLDDLLDARSALMQQAAERFVRWLVPAGKASRLPVVAITGTNGKTTVSRMTAHILQETGKVTGLQCTDGRFVNGVQTFSGDDSALTGHFCFYEDRSVELAVLESHHLGIATIGFAFESCDVAVCTNVTNEHIGYDGVDDLQDMVVLKRALLERAHGTAILNADDDGCCSMLPHIKARRICLVSLERTAADLANLASGRMAAVVTEQENGMEVIVLYDQERRISIIPVAEIPATFKGLARFNLMNSMQAFAAAWSMGAGVETAGKAIAGFEMSAENTPWRLNFYHDLPFDVLVDFAHSTDGIQRVSEFVSAMDVRGRRIIAFSGFRTDENVLNLSRAAAGHYDHYALKNYVIPENLVIPEEELNRDIPAMMKDELIRLGVPEAAISMHQEEMEGVRFSLDMARPGDLVVLLLGYDGHERIKDVIREYAERFDPK